MANTKTVRDFLVERGQNFEGFEKILDMQMKFLDGTSRYQLVAKEIVDIKRFNFDRLVVVLEKVSSVRARPGSRTTSEVTVYSDRDEDVFVGKHNSECSEILGIPFVIYGTVVDVSLKGVTSVEDVRCRLEID